MKLMPLILSCNISSIDNSSVCVHFHGDRGDRNALGRLGDVVMEGEGK